MGVRLRPGFILMEAVVTFLILSVAIVALIPLFSMAIKSNRKSEQTLVAVHLAQELMEEIKLRKWDQGTPSRMPGLIAAPGRLGVEAFEDKADKATFDDIDDFDGWTEDPPKDPIMRPLSDFNGYQRTAAVKYVGADFTPSVVPTDFKQATVCVKYQNAIQTCLERIFTNH